MGSDLPRHLQKLIDEIPENYEYSKHVLLRPHRLLVKKPDPGEQKIEDRPYRYWRTATGEELTVKYHKVDRNVGILTGVCDTLLKPVILGRDPSHAQKRFKVWRGIGSDFGAESTDLDLVIKDFEEPDWVDDRRRESRSTESSQHGSEVRKHSRSLESIHHGGIPKENELDSASDQKENPADGPAPSRPTTRSRTTRPRQNPPTVSPSHGFDDKKKDHSVSSDEEPIRRKSSQAKARAPSIELGSSHPIRNPPASPSRSVTAPLPSIEQGDTSVVEVALHGTLRFSSPAAAATSVLGNLHVYFKLNKTEPAGVPRRWAMCNTLRKLSGQAVAKGVLNSSEYGNALLVEVVCGGDRSTEFFEIAEGDEEQFEALHDSLKQIVEDWGLKGTSVEVSKI